jgi:hypothetical protein
VITRRTFVGGTAALSMIAPELVGKQVELLKEVVAKIFRVAVLGNPANPGTAPQLREAKGAAQALGLSFSLWRPLWPMVRTALKYTIAPPIGQPTKFGRIR